MKNGKIKRIILIILAVLIVLVIFGFIYERYAWKLENAKYGLKTSVKGASSTAVLFEVECSGGKIQIRYI